MFSKVPPLPPEPFNLVCNIETWDAEKPILRVHHSRFGATEFNPTVFGGRFSGLRDHGGGIVPTMYGSNTIDGALSETVFHDVPVSGPAKTIAQSTLMPMLSCTLQPARALRLVQLRGFGLKRLGITRVELIESKAEQYSVTRAWAAALYENAVDADGLIWMSRQHDFSEAIVLFGTRVRRDELEVSAPPRSLYPPSAGWDDVVRAAEAADIAIIMHDDAFR